MSGPIKKIWNVVSSILVALVVLLALLLVGARVVGLQVFVVLSGSMEPTYRTGSLIYVKKVDPYTIQEGQPITFMMNETTVATHRVVGIVPDEERSYGRSASAPRAMPTMPRTADWCTIKM